MFSYQEEEKNKKRVISEKRVGQRENENEKQQVVLYNVFQLEIRKYHFSQKIYSYQKDKEQGQSNRGRKESCKEKMKKKKFNQKTESCVVQCIPIRNQKIPFQLENIFLTRKIRSKYRVIEEEKSRGKRR